MCPINVVCAPSLSGVSLARRRPWFVPVGSGPPFLGRFHDVVRVDAEAVGGLRARRRARVAGRDGSRGRTVTTVGVTAQKGLREGSQGSGEVHGCVLAFVFFYSTAFLTEGALCRCLFSLSVFRISHPQQYFVPESLFSGKRHRHGTAGIAMLGCAGCLCGSFAVGRVCFCERRRARVGGSAAQRPPRDVYTPRLIFGGSACQ